MSQWIEGAEVIERTSTWGPTYRYGHPTRIAKVYKNGNFVLDGSSQQWSPRSDYASKTGEQRSYGSSFNSLVLLTSEIREDIARSAAYEAAFGVVKKEAERLDRVRRGKDVDATLAEAAAITARAQP